MSQTVLLYGVTGYTGRLTAEHAVAAGVDLVVAGRNAEAVARAGDALGVAHRAFPLDDPASVDRGLDGIAAVLNLAGPFARTGEPLAAACIRTGTHYLDIAGEVPEFEAIARHGGAAASAGVTLLPGVGLGVVPTDCLALHLKRRLPEAVKLRIGFATEGGVSRGTLGTVLPDLHREGRVLRDGVLVPERAAVRRLEATGPDGAVPLVSNPWRADLFTAARSTGIADVETYSAFPPPVAWLMARHGLAGFWNSGAWQAFLRTVIARLPEGPSEAERAKGSSFFHGEAEDAAGRVVRSQLVGPEAYDFTAATAVGCAQAVAAGKAPVGFQTPGSAFGPDFVTAFTAEGFRDLEGSTP